jgi:hypothetical protein
VSTRAYAGIIYQRVFIEALPRGLLVCGQFMKKGSRHSLGEPFVAASPHASSFVNTALASRVAGNFEVARSGDPDVNLIAHLSVNDSTRSAMAP